jgi:hypothetical protein
MTRIKSDICTGLSEPILTAPDDRNAVLIRGIREIRGSGANCRTCREEAQNTHRGKAATEWKTDRIMAGQNHAEQN